MLLEFKNPIPVITPLGKGFAIYMRDTGMFENDIWTVCLIETGEIKHFLTSQLKIEKNGTFDIKN